MLLTFWSLDTCLDVFKTTSIYIKSSLSNYAFQIFMTSWDFVCSGIYLIAMVHAWIVLIIGLVVVVIELSPIILKKQTSYYRSQLRCIRYCNILHCCIS